MNHNTPRSLADALLAEGAITTYRRRQRRRRLAWLLIITTYRRRQRRRRLAWLLIITAGLLILLYFARTASASSTAPHPAPSTSSIPAVPSGVHLPPAPTHKPWPPPPPHIYYCQPGNPHPPAYCYRPHSRPPYRR